MLYNTLPLSPQCLALSRDPYHLLDELQANEIGPEVSLCYFSLSGRLIYNSLLCHDACRSLCYVETPSSREHRAY